MQEQLVHFFSNPRGFVQKKSSTSARSNSDSWLWPPAMRRQLPRPSLCSSPTQGPSDGGSQLAEDLGGFQLWTVPSWRFAMVVGRASQFISSTIAEEIITVTNRNKIENNRPASNYRHYRFKINRKQYIRIKITDVTDVTVVTVINKKMALAGSWSDVGGAHIQTFTFSSQDHGRLSGEWCGVCVWCVVWVLCRCVCCVVVCCVVLLFFSQFSSFSFLLSLFPSSLSLSSLFPSSLFSLLSSLPLPLLSSLPLPLLATKHCGKNRSTNTAANIEACECDLAQGKCTAVGSLPPSLPSLLPSLPLLLKKRNGDFLLQEYFRRGIYFL